MGVLVILLVAAAYFAPFLVAASRSHINTGAIFALNLFLGWTLVGWVIALVWSLGNATPQIVINQSPEVNAVPAIGNQDSKTCPACAETVRAKATICRYCQYQFTAA